MPRELSPSEEREYAGYMALGPLEDVKAKLGKLPKVQGEAADGRKKIEALEKENGELKAKVPDGAVVLTGDDAKAYEAAKAAHGGIADLVKKADRTDAAEQEVAKRDRQDGIRAAAKTEGYDPDAAVKALSRDVEFAGLAFEVKEEQREHDAGGGKREKRATPVGYVTVDGKQVGVWDWVKSNADHILPALKGSSANGGGTQGREFVEQRGRSAPDGKGGVFDRIRAEVKKETAGEGVPSADTLAARLGGTKTA